MHSTDSHGNGRKRLISVPEIQACQSEDDNFSAGVTRMQLHKVFHSDADKEQRPNPPPMHLYEV